MATIIFSALVVTRNFFDGGESVCFHWADCRLVSGLNIGNHVFHNHLFHSRNHVFRSASAWPRLLRVVFTRRSDFFNCRTHERTFFTSITLSLHISLNCWWILMGFMPHKWRNRIITRCSSNVNVAISVSKTLLQLDHITSIQRGKTVLPLGLTQPKGQPRLLQHLSRFYLLPFPRKNK